MRTCTPVLLVFLFAYLFSVASAQTCLGSAPGAILVGPELVVNPGFESAIAVAPWYSGDAEGFALVLSSTTGFPGTGSYSAVINTVEARACAPRPTAGIFQQVFLNQTSAGIVHVSAWARGVNVSGVADANFSLYVDITFIDNTTLFGQFIPFPIDGNWNQVNLTINTTLPIDFFFLNVLFRNHTGTAFFDNISVRREVSETFPLDENILVDPSFASPTCQLTAWTLRSNDSLCTVQLGSCANETQPGNASTPTSNSTTTSNSTASNSTTSNSTTSNSTTSNNTTTSNSTATSNSTGGLTVTSNGTGACFNELSQTVCFNPPINNTLTFSVFLSLLPNSTDSLNIALFVDAQTFNQLNLPSSPTVGFQQFNVTLTPNTTISSVDVLIRWIGTTGIAWENATLSLS